MSKATIESTTSSFYAAAKLPGGALELAGTAHCLLNAADENGIGTSTFTTTVSTPAMASSPSPMKAVVAATRSINGRTQFSSPGQQIGSTAARKRLLFSPIRGAVPQSREVARIISEAQIEESQITTVDTVSTALYWRVLLLFGISSISNIISRLNAFAEKNQLTLLM